MFWRYRLFHYKCARVNCRSHKNIWAASSPRVAFECRCRLLSHRQLHVLFKAYYQIPVNLDVPVHVGASGSGAYPQQQSSYPTQQSSYPTQGQSPYPAQGQSPYPSQGQSPYPAQGQPSYPPQGQSAYPPQYSQPPPAPYPGQYPGQSYGPPPAYQSKLPRLAAQQTWFSLLKVHYRSQPHNQYTYHRLASHVSAHGHLHVPNKMKHLWCKTLCAVSCIIIVCLCPLWKVSGSNLIPRYRSLYLAPSSVRNKK